MAEQREWHFSAFGLNTSADEADNGFCRNGDGSVTVWSLNNHGKINLPSTDGVAFYYTAVPADRAFTLTARVHIDEWTFTNGQEGFGLMAADRVGMHGWEGSFWNNSYMAACTRVEYRLDPETGTVVTDSVYPLISMKLGIGAQEKTGITPENLPKFEAGGLDIIKKAYKSRIYPLECSCAELGGGTYNLFGNEKSGKAVKAMEPPLTEVTLRICKSAAGFELSYLNDAGAVIGTKCFYRPNALSVLDSANIYVGCFAARFCRATFSDITLETGHMPMTLPVAPPVQYVVPTCQILSSPVSNHAVYYLQFVTNANGTAEIRRAEQPQRDGSMSHPKWQGAAGNRKAPEREGREFATSTSVRAGQMATVSMVLENGENPLEIRFEPQQDYLIQDEPDAIAVINRTITRSFTVTLESPSGEIYAGKTIFAAPDGTDSGLGTLDSPVDVETAIRRARAGDEIILAGGIYQPGHKIQVERDMNGVPGHPIIMRAETGKRAVFDFEKQSAGFVFAGNYWEIEGIDCTNSADYTPGIVICGHDVHLHRAYAYENGECGIVVWTLLDTDTRDEWPHDVQVTSCISCSNSDPGGANADGFAAKLRVGPGVVFDQCISCYNADDGWDLFTKVEHGTTSPVVIKNCIAFGNGMNPYGRQRGYGNGFKLGGTSLPAGHYLYNCAAFNNYARGIDSNSAPNERIQSCTSFDNYGPNVTLLTSDAENTAYSVHGVVSCRKNTLGPDDILMPRGTQKMEELAGPNCFYHMRGQSTNADGLRFDLSWFESLDAPHPDPEHLLRDLEAMMDENGRIRLGAFLRLTENAEAELRRHGVDPMRALAHLDFNRDEAEKRGLR